LIAVGLPAKQLGKEEVLATLRGATDQWHVCTVKR
jgi:hypothetical protein